MSSDEPVEVVITPISQAVIAKGVGSHQRNDLCPCGSTVKAKKCCFTGTKVSAARMAEKQALRVAILDKRREKLAEQVASTQQAMKDGEKPSRAVRSAAMVIGLSAAIRLDPRLMPRKPKI